MRAFCSHQPGSSKPHLLLRCQGCRAPYPSPGRLQTDVEMKPRKMLLNHCHLTLLEAGGRRAHRKPHSILVLHLMPTPSPALYLQQQLPQPVQLGLQLLVVILKDLHAGLQAALVLPEDPCLCQELLVAWVLHQFGGARSQGWGFHCLIVLPLQTPQLSLEDPARQPRSIPPLSFLGDDAEIEPPGGFACSSTLLGWQAIGTQLLPRGSEQRQGKQSPPAVLGCDPAASPPSTRSSERREAAVARAHLKQFKRSTWVSRGGTHSKVGQEPFEEQNLGEHQGLTEFNAPQRLQDSSSKPYPTLWAKLGFSKPSP